MLDPTNPFVESWASKRLEALEQDPSERDWPFVPPKAEDLYRDAYIAQPDRFDWRSHSHAARAKRKDEVAMITRRRTSLSMRKGKESKVAAKARRKLEAKMDDRFRRISNERSSLDSIHYEQRDEIRSHAIDYREHWLEVMNHEREQELAVIRKRRKTPIEKLTEFGLAIDKLQAYWQDGSARHFGKRVAVFKLAAAQDLPRNQFRPGDRVTITRTDDESQPNPDADGINAEVVEKKRNLLRIKFDQVHEKIDLVACPSWRIDYGYNDLTYERIKSSLQALEHDVEHIETKYGSQHQYILSGTRLNDILLSLQAPPDRVTRGAFWEDARVQSWYDRFLRLDPIVIDGDPIPDLNETQTQAVAMMLKERISLVQGPPGTGKTRTIVTAIKLLKKDFMVPHPILLAAHTNVAVDNLAEGCINAGLKVVRIGPSSRARPSTVEHTLDAYFARHPSKRRHDEVKKALDTLDRLQSDLRQKIVTEDSASLQRTAVANGLAATAKETPAMSDDDDLAEELFDAYLAQKPGLSEYDAVMKQHKKLKRLWLFLRSSMRADILRSADVICGSAIAAGSKELEMIDLPVVFFDEASMATEPVTLIPLMKGCRHLCIIGDHKQLPPVVTSPEAKADGLSRSLFERLIEGGDKRVKSMMLDIQFRMHPSLAYFPNHMFYDGALRDGKGTELIAPVKSRFFNAQGSKEVSDPTRQYVSFVHHTARESKAHNQSLYNASEAQVVFDILIDLFRQNPELKGEDIGIVTPYAAQQLLFEKMLQNEFSAERKKARKLFAPKDAPRVAELGLIDIHTVDGFEGREKKVIIFSTVRTNPQGHVGFLADSRRLNVALTRAKNGLFVVGNIDTFRNARLTEAAHARVDSANTEAVRKYAAFLERHGAVFDYSDTSELEQVQDLEDAPEDWERMREALNLV